MFGPAIQHATAGNPRGLFKVLNITSWAGIAWVTVGFLGQVCFSGRMFLQWLVSERKQASIVTSSFWWFSLAGGLMLFCYFVWRRDLVGVLGQSSGIVIYARNIQLIRLQRRAARLAAA
ncbi:MAG: lipid-A-disaccharide synthase N-terminal domain-containing protein [Phycisphaerales bacterium]|nr:lipid-A-disaccharide synthase N-terminal domain-containing protein [Phycisphaerales bacterium]